MSRLRLRTCALILLASMPLCSCSMLTAQGRRERAYEHYVAKYSKRRTKQQSLLAKLRQHLPQLTPSQPAVSMQVTGPESVTSGEVSAN